MLFGFQDPASEHAQALMDFHHYAFFFLLVIMIFVMWMLKFVLNYTVTEKNFNFIKSQFFVDIQITILKNQLEIFFQYIEFLNIIFANLLESIKFWGFIENLFIFILNIRYTLIRAFLNYPYVFWRYFFSNDLELTFYTYNRTWINYDFWKSFLASKPSFVEKARHIDDENKISSNLFFFTDPQIKLPDDGMEKPKTEKKIWRNMEEFQQINSYLEFSLELYNYYRTRKFYSEPKTLLTNENGQIRIRYKLDPTTFSNIEISNFNRIFDGFVSIKHLNNLNPPIKNNKNKIWTQKSYIFWSNLVNGKSSLEKAHLRQFNMYASKLIYRNYKKLFTNEYVKISSGTGSSSLISNYRIPTSRYAKQFYLEDLRSVPFLYFQGVRHRKILEWIWTCIPAVILMLLLYPSLLLLYGYDRPHVTKPYLTFKAIGHQWYWSYEYTDHTLIFPNEFDDSTESGKDSTFKELNLREPIKFDSYLIHEKDLQIGQLRLLEVDRRIILPTGICIRLVATSADVVHSWAVPTLGVKIDAVPGRLNQFWLVLNKPGVFYGQCSELCGVNHGFMPIAVEGVHLDQYYEYVYNYYN